MADTSAWKPVDESPWKPVAEAPPSAPSAIQRTARAASEANLLAMRQAPPDNNPATFKPMSLGEAAMELPKTAWRGITDTVKSGFGLVPLAKEAMSGHIPEAVGHLVGSMANGAPAGSPVRPALAEKPPLGPLQSPVSIGEPVIPRLPHGGLISEGLHQASKVKVRSPFGDPILPDQSPAPPIHGPIQTLPESSGLGPVEPIAPGPRAAKPITPERAAPVWAGKTEAQPPIKRPPVEPIAATRTPRGMPAFEAPVPVEKPLVAPQLPAGANLTDRLKGINTRMDALGYPKLEGELPPLQPPDYADLMQRSLDLVRARKSGQ